LKKIITERFPHITVEEAGDGDEALAKLSDSRPHLIFPEIGLPGKNGIELTREIKANHLEQKGLDLWRVDLLA